MDNLRGAALMTLAMLGFAIEDMCIKLMSGALPTWQIVLYLSLGGATIFAALILRQGRTLITPEIFVWPVLLRNLCEVVGTMGFVTALSLSQLSTASAILQSAPLIVTLGAVAFLGESVGWRRWTAVIIGFAGVLLILRPGSAGFDPASLFAVIGVIFLAFRDLLTRRVPPAVTSLQVSFLAFVMLAPTAGILALLTGASYVPPRQDTWALAGLSVLLGVGAYYAIVAAMRVGDVSFVAPFRYSRLLFALIVGALVFGETPDLAMLSGATLIVGSGLFTFWREAQVPRPQPSA